MKLSAVKPVQLHPLTLKAVKRGHPWVTTDKFSKAFPKEFLLSTIDQANHLTFIHDPTHPDVKARLWSTTPRQYGPKDFEADLLLRISKAIEKRALLCLDQERDNFYLIFGEADQIPGLHVLKLKDQILIQIYAFCWRDHFIDLMGILNTSIKQFFPNTNVLTYWMQNRNHTKEIFYQAFGAQGASIKGNKFFEISEYGIKYQIEFARSYDFGIYTDMSAIRKELQSYMKGKVLNLFSYTGAFSLYALANGASEVLSVDLSEQYLNWLDQNLKLNPQLSYEAHSAICAPVDHTLHELIKDQQTFDCIISDPPSFSSDGKKSTSAIDQYPKRIELMTKILAHNGTMVLFLNTHSVNMSKFDQMVKETIAQISSCTLTIEKKLTLGSDCPTITAFSEGNYLKGIVLRKS